MYWVVTTVVSETKVEMRAKIIKQYIKISSEHTHILSVIHVLLCACSYIICIHVIVQTKFRFNI